MSHTGAITVPKKCFPLHDETSLNVLTAIHLSG